MNVKLTMDLDADIICKSVEQLNTQLEESYVKKGLKDAGFNLDIERQEAFKFIELDLILSEGERLFIPSLDFCLIQWKCYNLRDNYIEYLLILE
jgi:hypothetical protein